jgi:hypothetical protein
VFAHLGIECVAVSLPNRTLGCRGRSSFPLKLSMDSLICLRCILGTMERLMLDVVTDS